MIVRIMADNQYRVDAAHEAEITRLDAELEAAVHADDDGRFRGALRNLIQHVRDQGTVVPDDELVPSDVMIPAADMTLAEAKAVLEKSTAPHGGGEQ
ncbi:MAG TPA: hypothetical protein VID73_02450 [Ktedonobacterales bacterium]|jgi:hypothetical protein